jgi:hypothetical protein
MCWLMMCYFSLYCCDIYVICITEYFLSHLCTMCLCKDLGGALANLCAKAFEASLFDNAHI